MLVDWIHFTPWTALAGGILIGLACGALILLTGNIAGISGMLGRLLGAFRPHGGAIGWRATFLAGMLGAPLLWQTFAPLPSFELTASTPMLITAGLLVGIGTRFANGCTSGHGICGLSRLSLRSLAAVLCFMAAGFITVYLTRHVF
jgi:hypothetical protein